MRINRSKLIQHLSRLACSGQCTEVVFRDAFSANALTPDQLLLVSVPDLEGSEPLTAEIGVADLGLLTKALRLLPGEGNTGIEVDVYVQDNRLIIDDGVRGVQRLLTAAPKTIGTRIEVETVDKLFATFDSVVEVPLPQGVLEGVCSAFALYKAEEVELSVSAAGVKIAVGTEKTHRAEFALSDTALMQSYSLLFGKHLVDVFAVITDFSSAKLCLSGPAKPILIEDGEYSYILSPRSRSADDSPKGAVKADNPASEGEPKKTRRGRKKTRRGRKKSDATDSATTG